MQRHDDPHPTVPHHVGMADVRRIEAITAQCRAMDYRKGGGSCRQAVLDHLAETRPLLWATASDKVTARLYSAVADLHNLAGWTCFDTGLVPDARAQFGHALDLARLAPNPGLTANIYYRIGRVHLHHDQPDQATTCFQLGEHVARRAGSAHALAILSANQAWAAATMGHATDAVRLLEQARLAFTRSTSHPPAPWTAFFDQTDLTAITGVIHAELAVHVDPTYATDAIPELTAAAAGFGPDMARSRAFSLTALATAHLVDGNLDDGVRVGLRAVDTAAYLDCTRVLDRLRPLRNEACRHQRHSDTCDLIDHITTLRAAATNASSVSQDRLEGTG
ncbi:tetratricopeptide repeat protein [Solihabitans fulvus]|uniref:Tetratricopeptide repeat protein n=1 Tax=Solihabitans fulvus TaxID=1892852 RepID=A0A5B2XG34_9PSEU|nr:tetratricopeptide repeat protein [Solihabitans fulvus]KAA2261851.1 tetratricopeptide repeat protein [Solihabitans fulvus]